MNSPDTFILFQLKPLEHPSCLNYSHEETPQEHLKQQKPPLQNQETQLTHFPKRKMCLCVFGESMRVNKEPQSVMWRLLQQDWRAFKVWRALFTWRVLPCFKSTQRVWENEKSRTPPPTSTGTASQLFWRQSGTATIQKPIRGDKYPRFCLNAR